MRTEAFKATRLKLGMTQAEFGEFLGVSESTVAAIENNRRRISDVVRGKLAERISVNDELISFFDAYEKIAKNYPS
ncbi:DNA-binding transcriptional regulator [Bacillus sp. AFS041924]|uniref:helix-turn-helix domain-containing protein n=1 Tax=Bacillus sp. AFS041924 TaxID=2033503 RepID=UPI000BFB1C7D|nr:helix-turn-helix transcriptional regulator [Bacillus sp. AFS041924]PGS55101.1 transcriptional regulator [Bacillus sp. AFS041924]